MKLWIEKSHKPSNGYEWSVHTSYKEWALTSSEEKQKIAEWANQRFGSEVGNRPVWQFSNLDQAIEFCLVWG